MAAKRSRGPSHLTGGTGDVNPQFLSINAKESAANTYTETEIRLPNAASHIRPSTPGRAVVVELLYIMYLSVHDQFVAGPDRFRWHFATRSHTVITSFNATDVLWAEREDQGFFLTSGTWGGARARKVDFTDGMGHGILIAVDRAYVAVESVSLTNPSSLRMKIAYRFKEVPLTEYVGMIADQQG